MLSCFVCCTNRRCNFFCASRRFAASTCRASRSTQSRALRTVDERLRTRARALSSCIDASRASRASNCSRFCAAQYARELYASANFACVAATCTSHPTHKLFARLTLHRARASSRTFGRAAICKLEVSSICASRPPTVGCSLRAPKLISNLSPNRS